MLSSRSLTLVAGLALVGLAGCDRQSPGGAQPAATGNAAAASVAPAAAGTLDRSHRGTPLPAITVADPQGTTLNLAKLGGKPVLLNLWATWCAPCVAELPTLDALAAKGTIRVITVSQDMQTSRVAQFLRDKGGPHLPTWLDAKADLSFKFGGVSLPTTILYDAAGREVWRYGGGQDWTSAKAAKLIAEAG